ncbi:8762_t:CDS:1 [Ambispora leptoticha]|uniref:8762_t:CDS:1 n=1 Tax=Ambispora leptoticha TaxID=144679 RepID=A0A9N9GLM3_9GLOM|nr:8762_t:CDS:1 [Ambispora leptoticha]
MPRGTEPTVAECWQIVGMHRVGTTFRQISILIGKSKNCVANVVKRWKETGDPLPNKHTGRNSIICNIDLLRVELLTLSNYKSSLNQLTETWNTNNADLQVSPRTFRHCLYSLNIRRRVALRKPYLPEDSRIKRYRWACRHIN